MNKLLDILIPRFITEDVALAYGDDDMLHPICALSDIQDGEHYDEVAAFRSFNLFGVALFPKMIELKEGR
ncbi:hypothetical protein NVP1173O_01, partial [Vibrio phage 1.173.O._10N.261.55.A11]